MASVDDSFDREKKQQQQQQPQHIYILRRTVVHSKSTSGRTDGPKEKIKMGNKQERRRKEKKDRNWKKEIVQVLLLLLLLLKLLLSFSILYYEPERASQSFKTSIWYSYVRVSELAIDRGCSNASSVKTSFFLFFFVLSQFFTVFAPPSLLDPPPSPLLPQANILLIFLLSGGPKVRIIWSTRNTKTAVAPPIL